MNSNELNQCMWSEIDLMPSPTAVHHMMVSINGGNPQSSVFQTGFSTINDHLGDPHWWEPPYETKRVWGLGPAKIGRFGKKLTRQALSLTSQQGGAFFCDQEMDNGVTGFTPYVTHTCCRLYIMVLHIVSHTHIYMYTQTHDLRFTNWWFQVFWFSTILWDRSTKDDLISFLAVALWFLSKKRMGTCTGNPRKYAKFPEFSSWDALLAVCSWTLEWHESWRGTLVSWHVLACLGSMIFFRSNHPNLGINRFEAYVVVCHPAFGLVHLGTHF